MQDRYAFDIGDFGKFALLRALAPGRKLALCWYLCPGGPQEPAGDGRHITYLAQPERYQQLDPAVFRAFAQALPDGRNVRSLERLNLLPGTTYHSDPVPRDPEERRRWFARLLPLIDGCDLVLTDPDNGFETSRLSPKSIAWSEIEGLLRPGRALLLYHHQTRQRAAGAEFEHFADLLRGHGAGSVQAVRLRPFSSRFYFLVDADDELTERLQSFTSLWGSAAELFA